MESGNTKVLFTGSFNPWHNAHQYVFDVACKCFGKDNVWIGVGSNKNKPKEDKSKILFSLVPVTNNVIAYEGLTADVVKEHKFDILVRGIRPGKSLEQEEELLYWNRKLSGVETILIPTPPELNQISSSAIRELSNYEYVSEFIDQDVYYRWKFGDCNKYIYFGKTCSGKSTYLRDNMISALDCDKEIWDYVNYPEKETLKSQLINAFLDKNKARYKVAIDKIGRNIDWELFFLGRTRIDAAVIGVYWKFIPVKIRSKFMLIKVETTLENRMKFAKERNKSLEFIESADFFYQDPPFWDKLITIKEKN